MNTHSHIIVVNCFHRSSYSDGCPFASKMVSRGAYVSVSGFL